MEEEKKEGIELRSLIRGVIEEFVHGEQVKAEPAYKVELLDERKRREDLEKRVNDLVQENLRSRQMAEEAERSSAVRAELQRLGVAKVDLAYRAVKDDVRRNEDGQLIARDGPGEVRLSTTDSGTEALTAPLGSIRTQAASWPEPGIPAAL